MYEHSLGPHRRATRRVLALGAQGFAAFALGMGVSAAPASGQATARASAPATTQASAVPMRQGFHFSVGVGAASVSATCPGCDVNFIEDRISGLSGTLQIGGAVNEKLIIGVQANGWVKNDDVLYRRMASLSLITLAYPSPTSGFFLKGGIGGLVAVAETDFDYAETWAWSGETGIGVDVPIGGSAMISPYVSYVRTWAAQTWFDGFESPIAVTPNAIQMGAALTIH